MLSTILFSKYFKPLKIKLCLKVVESNIMKTNEIMIMTCDKKKP